MIKSSIEKLAEEIGYDIGMSDDETQSKLLNGFCKALSNSMRPNSLQMQICYITDKLTSSSREVIKELYEFIILKENNEK